MRPPRVRCFERREFRPQLCDTPRDLLCRRHIHIVFAKVDAGFEQRNQFHERLLSRRHPMTQRATQLARRLPCLRECLRLDQIANRLGLREIDAPCQKCTLRELARVGKTRTQLECAAQQQLQNHRRSVRGNFDNIFRRVGIRCCKKSHNGFINTFGLGVEHIGQARTRMLQRLARCDEIRRNRCRLWTAEANNPDASTAGRRGDGCDRVDSYFRSRHGMNSV